WIWTIVSSTAARPKRTWICSPGSTSTFVLGPILETFLKKTKDLFELVLFTGSISSVAGLIDLIDPNRHIKHRLLREHTLGAPEKVATPSTLGLCSCRAEICRVLC